MNIPRLLELADAIEHATLAAQGIGFNMSDWVSTCDDDMSGHSCKTTACIAGWAVELFTMKRILPETCEDIAAEVLGLDDYETQEALFYAGNIKASEMDDITNTHAATVLRHLAKTGEVDWSQGAPDA